MREQPPTGNTYEQGIALADEQEYLLAEAALTELQDEVDRITMAGQPVPPKLQAKLTEATQEFNRARDAWLMPLPKSTRKHH